MHLRCIRLWMITMAYRGFGDACFYLSNDSALSGIRRAFDYWSKAPDTWDILPERVSEQCFCQDTVQTYSSSTMQFTGACHRENIKTPLFPGRRRAVVYPLTIMIICQRQLLRASAYPVYHVREALYNGLIPYGALFAKTSKHWYTCIM